MKVLITGSIAYDVLLGFEGSFAETIRPEMLEKLSVSYFAPHYARHFGGSGSNIAWHFRLLGGDPMLVGAVGDDGDPFLYHLRTAGMSIDHITKVDGVPTATAVIGTDTSARQIAFYHPGADGHAPWPDVSSLKADLSYAIVSPRDSKRMIEAVESCSKLGIPVIFDPGQQVHGFGGDELKRLIKMSRGLIANAYEWNILRQATGLADRDIADLTTFVIITQAEAGVEIHEGTSTVAIPACPVQNVVNPTGAGDALRAGLLYGLCKGWSLSDATKLGAGIASFVVEQEGTMLERLDRDQLQERLMKAYGKDVSV